MRRVCVFCGSKTGDAPRHAQAARAFAAALVRRGLGLVYGGGNIGLMGVLAARQMGAAHIIAMSRHKARQELALEYGATHIVAERGDPSKSCVPSLNRADLHGAAPGPGRRSCNVGIAATTRNRPSNRGGSAGVHR